MGVWRRFHGGSPINGLWMMGFIGDQCKSPGSAILSFSQLVRQCLSLLSMSLSLRRLLHTSVCIYPKDTPGVHSRILILLRTLVSLHLAQHGKGNMSEPVGALLLLLLLCRCLSLFASPQHWHLLAQMCKEQKSKELASSSYCTGAFGQGLKAVATVTTAWLLPSWKNIYEWSSVWVLGAGNRTLTTTQKSPFSPLKVITSTDRRPHL